MSVPAEYRDAIRSPSATAPLWPMSCLDLSLRAKKTATCGTLSQSAPAASRCRRSAAGTSCSTVPVARRAVIETTEVNRQALRRGWDEQFAARRR